MGIDFPSDFQHRNWHRYKQYSLYYSCTVLCTLYLMPYSSSSTGYAKKCSPFSYLQRVSFEVLYRTHVWMISVSASASAYCQWCVNSERPCCFKKKKKKKRRICSLLVLGNALPLLLLLLPPLMISP